MSRLTLRKFSRCSHLRESTSRCNEVVYSSNPNPFLSKSQPPSRPVHRQICASAPYREPETPVSDTTRLAAAVDRLALLFVRRAQRKRLQLQQRCQGVNFSGKIMYWNEIGRRVSACNPGPDDRDAIAQIRSSTIIWNIPTPPSIFSSHLKSGVIDESILNRDRIICCRLRGVRHVCNEQPYPLPPTVHASRVSNSCLLQTQLHLGRSAAIDPFALMTARDEIARRKKSGPLSDIFAARAPISTGPQSSRKKGGTSRGTATQPLELATCQLEHASLLHQLREHRGEFQRTGLGIGKMSGSLAFVSTFQRRWIVYENKLADAEDGDDDEIEEARDMRGVDGAGGDGDVGKSRGGYSHSPFGKVGAPSVRYAPPALQMWGTSRRLSQMGSGCTPRAISYTVIGWAILFLLSDHHHPAHPTSPSPVCRRRSPSQQQCWSVVGLICDVYQGRVHAAVASPIKLRWPPASILPVYSLLIYGSLCLRILYIRYLAIMTFTRSQDTPDQWSPYDALTWAPCNDGVITSPIADYILPYRPERADLVARADGRFGLHDPFHVPYELQSPAMLDHCLSHQRRAVLWYTLNIHDVDFSPSSGRSGIVKPETEPFIKGADPRNADYREADRPSLIAGRAWVADALDRVKSHGLGYLRSPDFAPSDLKLDGVIIRASTKYMGALCTNSTCASTLYRFGGHVWIPRNRNDIFPSIKSLTMISLKQYPHLAIEHSKVDNVATRYPAVVRNWPMGPEHAYMARYGNGNTAEKSEVVFGDPATSTRMNAAYNPKPSVASHQRKPYADRHRSNNAGRVHAAVAARDRVTQPHPLRLPHRRPHRLLGARPGSPVRLPHTPTPPRTTTTTNEDDDEDMEKALEEAMADANTDPGDAKGKGREEELIEYTVDEDSDKDDGKGKKKATPIAA
ncbi:hypothetical protein CONPUDRAFT_77558 [Coniophora puteana RWD-64-598 SS2]|uniref:Uncharacterized protein n=1 Tax=Coniophora puteana (strain RWD-64-598) TaxID=741705 RepID=A0A5M3M8I1_CONPW|nr:uncharacterized protein CONPUDRAFT_77558 [Coniophora puteana RWD-64-598 SS2]EIW75353.1 hypothetical protein CONPUDRAFT_77558 [Coniophora puteana RWD-64-598 SS2]